MYVYFRTKVGLLPEVSIPSKDLQRYGSTFVQRLTVRRRHVGKYLITFKTCEQNPPLASLASPRSFRVVANAREHLAQSRSLRGEPPPQPGEALERFAVDFLRAAADTSDIFAGEATSTRRRLLLRVPECVHRRRAAVARRRRRLEKNRALTRGSVRAGRLRMRCRHRVRRVFRIERAVARVFIRRIVVERVVVVRSAHELFERASNVVDPAQLPRPLVRPSSLRPAAVPIRCGTKRRYGRSVGQLNGWRRGRTLKLRGDG
eukprot:30890-Pelagococcus_subviridis.AAC.15